MKLWFVVPAHGRIELARICLRQLRRTCDALVEHGIEASAVVIACDENLETAAELGFGTVRRDNRFLARKYNDGIQLALDPSVNPRPADYAVPMGSDDWIDYRILLRPPPRDAVLGFRRVAFVDESGSELTETELRYEGGVGIRVYPRRLLEPSGYRPADEDRKRACDTSILYNAKRNYRRQLRARLPRPLRRPARPPDRGLEIPRPAAERLLDRRPSSPRPVGRRPFQMLDGLYPAEALAEMAEHYQAVPA